MAETDPEIARIAHGTKAASAIPSGRMALLFTVMLVTAAGNTAMQSVMPSIGTALQVDDVWISLAYSWSALLWVVCAPLWARRSDRRGRKAMMALGLVGFITSMLLCGLALYAGLSGWLSAVWALIAFAAARSLYGGFGSAAPPAVQAYVASRTPRSQRTQALSLIASSFGLGTVIGPALAPLMFPIEFIGHLARPISLSVRLFGNIFGEESVIAILLSLSWLVMPYLIWLGVMLPLSLFTAVVQTFVFIMLSMVYIAGAVEGGHAEERHSPAAGDGTSGPSRAA